MDNLTENERVAAEAAEAEGNKAAAALGKFKDVQTLMKAYSDLEAEFTRRSQRLKELEKENKAEPNLDEEKATPSRTGGDCAPPSKGDGACSTPSQKSDDERIAEALSDKKVRDAIIGDYLRGLAENKIPLVGGGGAVTAPRNTPKTVKEAGKFARQFLKG